MTARFTQTGQWPKQLPALTVEQQEIREDFYSIWLTQLPKRFGFVERFNHCYPLRSFREIQSPTIRTLDIGAGRGTHIPFEPLDRQSYMALELRSELASEIRSEYPMVNTVVGDIQDRLDFDVGFFERIPAIYVLEHLPNLPVALDEIRRLLNNKGRFSVLIPCDPGFAYTIARNLSARRIFEQRYKQSYDWFIASEHINSPQEIIEQLEKRFQITHQVYFPLVFPMISMNLVIGLTLKNRRVGEN